MLDEGLLPAGALAPVREWLDGLAADAEEREGLVRRTLVGALDSIPRRVQAIERVVLEQEREAGELRGDVSAAYDARSDPGGRGDEGRLAAARRGIGSLAGRGGHRER